MNDDLSNVMNHFSQILKDKNIDINQSINKTSDNSNSSNNQNTQANQNSFTSNANSSSDFNLDIQTILKIKDIMGKMNQKNIPRNNLLNSLKPFLRKEKQEKLDEYIKYANLLNLLELFNSTGGEKNNDTKPTT